MSIITLISNKYRYRKIDREIHFSKILIFVIHINKVTSFQNISVIHLFQNLSSYIYYSDKYKTKNSECIGAIPNNDCFIIMGNIHLNTCKKSLMELKTSMVTFAK